MIIKGYKKMKNNNINQLNTIEWKIYNFLKERTENNLWTKQQEIIDYLGNQNIKCDKRTLRRYIQNIRKSDLIQKIILTSYSKGYRLMSEENELKILTNRKIAILKSLKQYYKDINRLKLNNQMKLQFDTKEREFIESLLKVGNSSESNM